MNIRELQLDHFGRFHGKNIQLQPGINVVYGPNESGKSTVHGFVQCMFFGAERLRGRGAGKDTYSKYQPWDSQGSYAGRMTFEYKGKKYRIVRNFQRDSESFDLVDLTTGKTVLDGDHIISEMISGMTPVNYRNSISCGQLCAEPDNQFAGNMQSFLANMSMSASEKVDVTKAMAYLKDERKKVGSRISEEEYEKCLTRQDELKEELAGRDEMVKNKEQLTGERDGLKAEYAALDKKVKLLQKEDQNERMKAIKLIQENNDVADMYRMKKHQLNELTGNRQNDEDRQKLLQAIEECQNAESEIDDLKARCDELEGQGDGSIFRGLALILPAVALTVIIYMAGGLLGLYGVLRTAVTAILAVLTAVFAVMLFRSGRSTRKRIQQIHAQISQLEKRQRELYDAYQVEGLDQLQNLNISEDSSRELIARLNLELKQLRDRYDQIQGPLKPYMEKYGESVTLESDAGQEEMDRMAQMTQKIEELSGKIDLLDWQIEQLAASQTELERLEEKSREMKEIHRVGYEDLQALEITENVISELTTQIHGTFGSQLGEYVSQMIGMITDEKHHKLSIDEKFQVLVDNDRVPVHPQQLSAGTSDQIYFSVRIAVSQLLFQDEPMPLILDESFALYDDARLERTLGWLAGQRAFSQVIIFTCHHREMELLNRICCPYNLCEL